MCKSAFIFSQEIDSGAFATARSEPINMNLLISFKRFREPISGPALTAVNVSQQSILGHKIWGMTEISDLKLYRVQWDMELSRKVSQIQI
jgi:hypothetical protein